jgi:hypothetical protein
MADREPGMRNEAAPWSDFDPDRYSKDNYASIYPEDAEIIRFASSFLIEAFDGRPKVRRAVDVGAGPNLYPALMMLPWTEHITFTEHAPLNIEWLNANLVDERGEWDWQPFWTLMADQRGYEEISRPRRRLAASHDVLKASVFDLPKRAWQLGTMFFVADGLSEDAAEFEEAVRSFLAALVPRAPFVMAFMEGSPGYEVGGIWFPAVKLRREALIELLAKLPVTGVKAHRTDKSIRPVREDYDAMLCVTGHVTGVKGQSACSSAD